MRLQANFAEHRLHRLCRVAGKLNGFRVNIQIHIAHNSRNLPAYERGIFVITDVFELFALELIKIFVDALHTAELLQKFRGGFRTNAGNTRNVVGTIAHKTQIIRNEFRTNAVFFCNFGRAHNHDIRNTFFHGNDARKLACQLAGIFVARKQQRFEAKRLIARSNGS